MGPKKGIVAQQNNVINRKIVPPPPPPPLANVNQKVRPLQRVQPLQIQSPSMISMVLQQNTVNTKTVNTGTKYHHQKHGVILVISCITNIQKHVQISSLKIAFQILAKIKNICKPE